MKYSATVESNKATATQEYEDSDNEVSVEVWSGVATLKVNGKTVGSFDINELMHDSVSDIDVSEGVITNWKHTVE